MKKLTPWICLLSVIALMIAGMSTLVTAEDKPTPPPDATTPPATPPAETKVPAPAVDAKTPPATAPDAAKEFPESLEFTKVGEAGTVTFDHAGHADKNTCADCHEGTTPMFKKARSETPYTMVDMYAGKNCGACHNGKKAFAAKGDCSKCHAKD